RVHTSYSNTLDEYMVVVFLFVDLIPTPSELQYLFSTSTCQLSQTLIPPLTHTMNATLHVTKSRHILPRHGRNSGRSGRSGVRSSKLESADEYMSPKKIFHFGLQVSTPGFLPAPTRRRPSAFLYLSPAFNNCHILSTNTKSQLCFIVSILPQRLGCSRVVDCGVHHSYKPSH
ncbi:hypothetical protein Moror_16900, partial [Moniliophthora roreri MCA 2997]